MNGRWAYAAFMIAAGVVFLLLKQLIPSPKKYTALPWNVRFCLAAGGLVGGVIGAKLPFVLSVEPDSSFWLADGKTITTGLIGAYIAVELVKLLVGVTFKTGDRFAIPLAAAVAVGRWGCFYNGCCHGEPTNLPWGVDFGDGVPRHPTQIYESAFHLLMAGVLTLCFVRGWFVTHRLQLYLICYGLYRFGTEFIRPEVKLGLGLTYYQYTSAVIVLGCALQLCWEARQAKAKVPAEPVS